MPNTPQPLALVYILLWNGNKWIGNCLKSILQDPYPHYKVFVIDNASSDNSVDIVERDYPQITVIKNRKNYGFAEGNNIGIRHALKNKADYVVLLNQDIVTQPLWLTRLIEAAIKNPEYEALSPIIFDYHGHNIDPLCLRKLMCNGNFKDVDYPQNDFQNKVYETTSLLGSALFFKKSIFSKVGLFDPLLFLYHEESDFFQRTAYHKIRLAIVTSSKVNHWHTALHPKKIRFCVKYLTYRNLFIIKLKNPNHTILTNFVEMFKSALQIIKEAESLYDKAKRSFLILYVFVILILRLPQILYKRFKEKRGPVYL